MELLDRYLQAVRFWLPGAEKEDVAAELSDEIRSQIEERETSLGRTLNDEEVGAILERIGHPILVAGKYAPSRHLIGPVFFPLYRLTLKIVALVYLLPWLAVWVAFLIGDPDRRGSGQVRDALTAWWLIALHLFVFVTVLFAALERSGLSWLGAWNPGKLPPDNPNHVPRTQSVTELVAALVVVLWWVGVLRFPAIPEVQIRLTRVWDALYWPILILYVATAALAAAHLARPWWTRRRSAVRLAIDAGGIVIIGVLLAAQTWVAIGIPSATAADAGKVAAIEGWVNLSVRVGLLFTGIMFVLRGVQDGFRLLNKRPIHHWAITMLTGQ